MGQSANGDEVHATGSIVRQCLEGDAAAGFGFKTPGNEFNGCAGHFDVEVVEHDAVCAGFGMRLLVSNHATDVIQRATLDFHLQMQPLLFLIGGAAVKRLLDASAEVNVIVLQQDHVEEPDAVVHAAADFDGFFFEHAHSGRGLASVKDAGVIALQTVGIDSSHGGDAAHALHDVQHETLGLEQGAHLARNHHGNVAGLDASPVRQKFFHLQLGVKAAKNLTSSTHSGEHAFFFDEKMALSDSVFGNTAKGGVVSVTNVLSKSEVNQTVIEFIDSVHDIGIMRIYAVQRAI